MADIRTETEDSFTYWKDNSTEAQRAIGVEEMRKFGEEPEWMQAEMAAMQTDFDAQSPVDGRLDEAKYVAWMRAMQTRSAARGNF